MPMNLDDVVTIDELIRTLQQEKAGLYSRLKQIDRLLLALKVMLAQVRTGGGL